MVAADYDSIVLRVGVHKKTLEFEGFFMITSEALIAPAQNAKQEEEKIDEIQVETCGPKYRQLSS